jgi:hypothetical protein
VGYVPFAYDLRRPVSTFTSTMNMVATYVGCCALTAIHVWWVVLKTMFGHSDSQTTCVAHRPRLLWDGR